jgi:DNA-binding MarR family transcriptional regulator
MPRRTNSASASKCMPKAIPSKVKKNRGTRERQAPDTSCDEPTKHQNMLTVLKQFRIVIRNIKTQYQDIQKVTGVSGAQLWTLCVIAEKPGIKAGELARALAVHQSTVSNLLDRLSQLGYLERRREGIDQRVVTIHLTRPGYAIVKGAPQPAIGLLQNALLSLTDERLSGLQQHLNELILAIGLENKADGATPISMFITE